MQAHQVVRNGEACQQFSLATPRPLQWQLAGEGEGEVASTGMEKCIKAGQQFSIATPRPLQWQLAEEGEGEVASTNIEKCNKVPQNESSTDTDAIPDDEVLSNTPSMKFLSHCEPMKGEDGDQFAESTAKRDMSAPEAVAGRTCAEDLSKSDISDGRSTSLTNLLCVWSMGFITAIENTICIPSLWGYVQSLGGSHREYAMCISAFPAMRVACLGIFGMWVDRRPLKEVFVVSLLVSIFASYLYTLGPTLGIWAVVISRALMGAMSGTSSAARAFETRYTSVADRSYYMSVDVFVRETLKVAGPAFNLFIVNLPDFTVALGSVGYAFNHFTWVGYFTMACQLLALASMLLCFHPPPFVPQKPAASLGWFGDMITLGGFFPWMRIFVDPWLRRTGAWLIFVLNSRNAIVWFAWNWTIPLVTKHDYGFGQVQNSYIFFGLAVESVMSLAVITYLTKRLSDRAILLLWQFIACTGWVFYVTISRFGTQKVPLAAYVTFLIWQDFGTCMPVVQSLYSKLVGPGNAGMYFSALHSNAAISQAAAGHMIGVAFSWLGVEYFYGTIMVIWIFSWVLCGIMFQMLDKDYISTMHEHLGESSKIAGKDESPPSDSVSLQPSAKRPARDSLGFEQVLAHRRWGSLAASHPRKKNGEPSKNAV